MAATKNAHDWHCEDHDTYGWRGEDVNSATEIFAESGITTTIIQEGNEE